MKDVEENARNFTFRTVNQIETVLSSVKKIPQNLAFFLEESNLEKQQMEELLRLVVSGNDEIYGAGISFEPYAFDGSKFYFSPYYAKEKEGLVLYYLGDEEYRYFLMDWYQIPRELNRPYWSEPYFDDILMTTYSVPFYQNTAEGKKIKGIVSADISLEWLAKLVSSIKVLETGDAYLLSKNGTIITHNLKDLIMNETIFSVAEARGDASLREIGRKMIKGESGFAPFKSIARGKDCWMYYAPVPSTGWALAVLFPEDEFLADIHKLNRRVGLLGISGILLLMTAIVLISRSITRPLIRMSDAAAIIGGGNLDVALPQVQSRDEIGRLAEAFGNMQASLKDYIRKLTEATAAKERIESELKIAREIQTSMLPRIFPPFPQRKDFDIYATMKPAKEVGGDFYDFFLINEKKLCLLMGDVSGKGVPAALFMMIAKTLLKNQALDNMGAGEVLYRVNNIVALDNETSMFATVFCAILDTESGELEFSNAGHNPPLLARAGENFEFLKVDKNFVLGPVADLKFSSQKIKLSRDDTLFLYTDGVTEAMNPEKDFFLEKRAQEGLSKLRNENIIDMVKLMQQEISDFAQGEPQSDDITMLVLRYHGQL